MRPSARPSLGSALAWLVAALLVAAAFRAPGLGMRSLWLDEIGQAAAAEAPWPELPAKVAQHLSPPLDYAVSKLALAWGRGEGVLRAPALFFSLLSLPIFFAIAMRVLPGGGAAFALWLLALSPLALQYAREARMYALFLALSLAAWLLSLRFRTKPSLGSALAWGLAGGLALLTHYFAVFALAAQALAALGALRRSPAAVLGLWLAAVALMALLFAPWLPWALEQWRSSGGAMAYGLHPDLSFFKQALSGFASASGFRDAWFYAFFAAALGGALLAWKKGEGLLQEAALSFALSLVLLWGLSFWKPLVTVRNLIYLLPFYLLLAARGLAWLQERFEAPAWALAVLLLAALSPALQARRQAREAYQPDWRGAAEAIRRQDPDGSGIVWVPDTHSRACLAWYLTPDADTVFMHARSLDGGNRDGDRIRVLRSEDARAWLHGERSGLALRVGEPLGPSPELAWPGPAEALWSEDGPQGQPVWLALYAAPPKKNAAAPAWPGRP